MHLTRERETLYLARIRVYSGLGWVCEVIGGGCGERLVRQVDKASEGEERPIKERPGQVVKALLRDFCEE